MYLNLKLLHIYFVLEWVQTTNKALAVSITGSMSDSFPLHLLGK